MNTLPIITAGSPSTFAITDLDGAALWLAALAPVAGAVLVFVASRVTGRIRRVGAGSNHGMPSAPVGARATRTSSSPQGQPEQASA